MKADATPGSLGAPSAAPAGASCAAASEASRVASRWGVSRWAATSRLLREHALVGALVALSVLYAAYPLGLMPGGPPRARLLWFFESEQRWRILVGCWWAATAVAVLALLLRRHLPVAAFVAAVLAAGWHLGDNWFGAAPIDLAVGITYYTAALGSRTRHGPAVLLGAGLAGCSGLALTWQAVLMPAWERAPVSVVGPWPLWAGDLLLPAVVLVPAWFAVHLRRGELALLDERARLLERERDQRESLAAAAERARISREVHDAIGHSLSIMVIQTQAAAGVLTQDPAAASHALEQVVTVGQRALTEIRSLLGVLRAEASPTGTAPPLAGLALLPDLAARVRRAGVPVTLRLDPDLRVPALVDLSAYRIVQEALTNTIKHAGTGTGTGIRVTVTVTVTSGSTSTGAVLRIEVLDTGATPGQPRYWGNGLRGMRERAGALGGTVAAGPAPPDGFRVQATLPLPAAP
ncbi:MAG: two-component sensor histidine kinase [Dactylosporangium sp.]|nr:hypothetical protein [Dactylosporangium sp.]NNJ59425.1 two-component sensor histidine kinase [Dactylosporangium sp.]